MSDSSLPRTLLAVLYADVAGYSRLTEADEEATHRRLSEFLDHFAQAVQAGRGRVVHYAGDALLATFASAVEALACAARVQAELASRNESLPEDRRVQFRVGLNLGDVIEDRGDVYGDGVNVAARLEALAEPGGICISGSFHDAIGQQLPFEYTYLGEQQVKNIARPVRAYHASLREGTDLAALPRVAPGRRPRKKRAWPLVAALCAGGIAVGVAAWWRPWATPVVAPPAETAAPSPDAAAPPRVIVLPFANHSNDKTQEYFADGVTEDLTTDLSRLGSLRVVSRSTAFSYKGQPIKHEEFARDLGVRYVIDGSVQKAGERVRINVRLTDATGGNELWAERFDRGASDLFAVQDEIAQRLVDAMAVTLSAEERRRLAHRYTSNIEAYDLFLRGQEAYVRQAREDIARAQNFFRQAIALDPNFARSYAALALTYIDDWRFRWSPQADLGADEALRLANRAVEIDDQLPQAYWALGFVHIFRREHREAIQAAERAVALDPNNADAYVTLAISSAYAGEAQRAIELMHTAMEMNPRYGSRYASVLGLANLEAGKYEEARVAYEDSVARNPARIPPRLLLAITYEKLGRHEDAEWQADEVLAIKPDFTLDTLERISPFQTDAELEERRAILRRIGFK